MEKEKIIKQIDKLISDRDILESMLYDLRDMLDDTIKDLKDMLK